MDASDVLRPGDSPLLEVPVTTGHPGASRVVARASTRIPSWLPGGRSLARLARFTILRPALHGRADLLRLTRACLASGEPVLNVMLHSTELAPGQSPYSRDVAQRDRLLQRLRTVLEAAVGEGHAQGATLSQVPDALAAREVPQAMPAPA